MNSAPSSASAVDVRTLLMIAEYTWIVSLIGGVGYERDDELLDKKKYSPDLLLVIHLLKYEVSLFCVQEGPCRWHDIVWWHWYG